jgi:YVTN family beta-propeller protein
VAVSNETSNDVYLISTTTREVADKIAAGKNPRGMRFTGDSRRLYVACEASNELVVIDVSRRAVVHKAASGGVRPVDLLFTADGRKLIVSHGGSGDVRIYDAATLTPEHTIPVGPRAWWMTMSPDGKTVYVTVGRANEVAAIDTTTWQVSQRYKAGTLPWGITIADVPRAAGNASPTSERR